MPGKLSIGVITKYAEGTYHGNIVSGIHGYTKRHNTNLFILNTFMINRFYSNVKKIESYYPLAFNNIDGWIVLTEGASEDYLSAIIKTDKPLIMVGIDEGRNIGTVVKSDNYDGAKAIVEHLIFHGHKKIGFIGWMEINDIVERLNSYKDTLKLHGLPYDENLVYRTDSNLPGDGRSAVEYWIKSGFEFTAIFAGSDSLAMGAIAGLNNMGLYVPKDVAVVGYDNSTFAKSCIPGITTIEQNVYTIGYKAAETLLEEINKKRDRGKTVLVQPGLILRKSCGCNCETDDGWEPTDENIKIKNSIIRYLEDMLYKNSDVGSKLLTTNIAGISRLFPRLVDNCSWGCMGYWDEEQPGNSSLKVRTDLYNADFSCNVESFPPKELMPDLDRLNNDDVIWVMPISSTTRNWGVMSYISSFNKATALLKYNVNIVLFTLLGIAMDRAVAKTELEIALESLKQTQNQLIQTEKMAALGGIVAGVAHEINTPVGVSVTAASYLDEKNNEILELFETGKLKKADLEKHINTTMETIKILMINLERASNLIGSFKQIAVDQSVDEKRVFVLKDYINEVLLSLNPKVKKTKHKIIVDCEDDIEIYASPGGLSQIIANLVVNSLVHAFDDSFEGIIKIKVKCENSEIIIEYSDNGKGISENDIKKIYEPFFTTKRGSGGTGLGLNIVYNIVSKEYNGKIKCNSIPGNGTIFTIRIPEEEVNKSYVR